MKKLFALGVLTLSALAFVYAEQLEEHSGHQSKQGMMMEHMQKCQQQMMGMMMENPKFMERLMGAMLQHKETMKKVLENNPQLKKQMEEMFR